MIGDWHYSFLGFRKYVDLLFDISKNCHLNNFETLEVLFTGLYDVKWYLLARLRKVLVEKEKSIYEFDRPELKEAMFEPIVRLLALRQNRRRAFEEKVTEIIAELNAAALFPDSTSTIVKYIEEKEYLSPIQGSLVDRLELKELLVKPFTEPGSQAQELRIELYLDRLFKLTGSLKLSGAETSLLLVATFPEIREELQAYWMTVSYTLNTIPSKLLERPHGEVVAMCLWPIKMLVTNRKLRKEVEELKKEEQS